MQTKYKKEKTRTNSIIQSMKSDLSEKKVEKFKEAAKRTYIIFYETYKLNSYAYNVKLINDIVYNEKANIVAIFKDFLIYDDSSEFLKRFYKLGEAEDRLPKLFDYYENYSKIFPNYIILPEAKFIYKNIQKKQRLIDTQQMLEMNNGVNKDNSSYVFDTKIHDSIMNISQSFALNHDLFTKKSNKENSFLALIECIENCEKSTNIVTNNEVSNIKPNLLNSMSTIVHNSNYTYNRFTSKPFNTKSIIGGNQQGNNNTNLKQTNILQNEYQNQMQNLNSQNSLYSNSNNNNKNKIINKPNVILNNNEVKPKNVNTFNLKNIITSSINSNNTGISGTLSSNKQTINTNDKSSSYINPISITDKKKTDVKMFMSQNYNLENKDTIDYSSNNISNNASNKVTKQEPKYTRQSLDYNNSNVTNNVIGSKIKHLAISNFKSQDFNSNNSIIPSNIIINSSKNTKQPIINQMNQINQNSKVNVPLTTSNKNMNSNMEGRGKIQGISPMNHNKIEHVKTTKNPNTGNIFYIINQNQNGNTQINFFQNSTVNNVKVIDNKKPTHIINKESNSNENSSGFIGLNTNSAENNSNSTDNKEKCELDFKSASQVNFLKNPHQDDKDNHMRRTIGSDLFDKKDKDGNRLIYSKNSAKNITNSSKTNSNLNNVQNIYNSNKSTKYSLNMNQMKDSEIDKEKLFVKKDSIDLKGSIYNEKNNNLGISINKNAFSTNYVYKGKNEIDSTPINYGASTSKHSSKVTHDNNSKNFYHNRNYSDHNAILSGLGNNANLFNINDKKNNFMTSSQGDLNVKKTLVLESSNNKSSNNLNKNTNIGNIQINLSEKNKDRNYKQKTFLNLDNYDNIKNKTIEVYTNSPINTQFIYNNSNIKNPVNNSKVISNSIKTGTNSNLPYNKHEINYEKIIPENKSPTYRKPVISTCSDFNDIKNKEKLHIKDQNNLNNLEKDIRDGSLQEMMLKYQNNKPVSINSTNSNTKKDVKKMYLKSKVFK